RELLYTRGRQLEIFCRTNSVDTVVDIGRQFDDADQVRFGAYLYLNFSHDSLYPIPAQDAYCHRTASRRYIHTKTRAKPDPGNYSSWLLDVEQILAETRPLQSRHARHCGQR